MKTYIILYIISPFLNILIKNLNKNQHQQCIYTGLLIDSIFLFIFIGLFSDEGNLFHFILLYIIGSYIHKYDIINNIMIKLNLTKKRFIYILVITLFPLINISFYYLGTIMSSTTNSILYTVGNFIVTRYMNYTNILVIVPSVTILLLFGTFNFKSKIINYISASTLGVYMIHDSDMLRLFIYRFFKINTGQIHNNFLFIPYSLLIAILIFIICIFIDKIRELIFNLLNKIKPINNFYYKFIDIITSLGI